MFGNLDCVCERVSWNQCPPPPLENTHTKHHFNRKMILIARSHTYIEGFTPGRRPPWMEGTAGWLTAELDYLSNAGLSRNRLLAST